jgi:hypothetical protein
VFDKLPIAYCAKFSQGVDVTKSDVEEFFGIKDPYSVIGDLPGVMTMDSDDLQLNLYSMTVIPDGILVRIVFDAGDSSISYYFKGRMYKYTCKDVYDETFEGYVTRRDGRLVYAITKVDLRVNIRYVPYYDVNIHGMGIRNVIRKDWYFIPCQTNDYSEVLALCCGVPIKGLELQVHPYGTMRFRKWVFRQRVTGTLYRTDTCVFPRLYDKQSSESVFRVAMVYKRISVRFEHIVSFIGCLSSYFMEGGCDSDYLGPNHTIMDNAVSYDEGIHLPFSDGVCTLKELCVLSLMSRVLVDHNYKHVNW